MAETRKVDREECIACIVDGANGIYVPKSFTTRFEPVEWGFKADDEDWAICAKGPDEEEYWEAWAIITANAVCKKDGHTWTLFEDGDLFALRDDLPEDDELFC